jgi:hypothetical protein
MNLKACDRDDGDREAKQGGIDERSQIHAEAGNGEKNGAEECDDEAPYLAFDMLGQNRRLPTRMPATKEPSAVCIPISSLI